MPPILGNAIALLMVAALVYVCARNLWLDHRQGGGCASCGGSCGGSCAGCGGCSVSTGGSPAGGNGPRSSGRVAYNGKIYHVDVDGLRVHRTDTDGNL